METLWTDLRGALRTLVARPLFTILVLGPLALGIGLNTAMFSAVHSVLLRSLPYEDPESLVRVWEARPRMGADAEQMAAFSMGHFRQWRDDNDVFSGMAAMGDVSFNLTGGVEPQRVEGQNVSPALFRMLGVEPVVGRYFTDEEEVPGNDRVAVLSYGLWRQLFGEDPGVVGARIDLNGIGYDVVGVMPSEFRFPDPSTELWVPLAMSEPEPMRPGEMRIELVPVIAKLRPGVTPQQAEAAAEAFLNHLRETSETAQRMDEGVSIHLTSLHEQLVRPVRPALLVLFGAVGFVLLIVCANVTNLFLVRAQDRERELAVRAALGAGRKRLVWRLLSESLVYGLAGGALGAIVAYWCVRAFSMLRPPDGTALTDVSVSGTVLLFNFAAALVAGLIVGVLPAWRAGRVDLVTGLKSGGAATGHPGRHLVRQVLAIVEVSLALVLFIAAGLMLRSFMTLTRVDPGYEPSDVLTFRLNLPQTKYADAQSQRSFHDRAREAFAALPGVQSVGIVNVLPLDGSRFITSLIIEGRPPVEDRMKRATREHARGQPGLLSSDGHAGHVRSRFRGARSCGCAAHPGRERGCRGALRNRAR